MKKIKTVKKTKSIIKPVTKQEENNDFAVTFKVFGKIYTSTGHTLKEAVEALDYKGKVAGVTIFSVSHNGITKERVMNSIIANRLFTQSRLMREIAVKNILTLFDN